MLGSAKLNLLVTSSPDCPELKILEALKDEVHTVAVGRSLAELSHLRDDEWKNIDVILNCGALPLGLRPLGLRSGNVWGP